MQRLSRPLTLTFSSIAHAYSHLFILLYATVVLVLEREWGLSYAELFAVSIPMTVLFGAGALPAGWLADRWSAPGMIAVFFLGVGAASILTGFAESPLGIGAGLALMGLFASIYHPVGIPWAIKNSINRGRVIAIIGVFGSAGMAGAAIIAGVLAAYLSWRAAFIVPGLVCVLTGLAFVLSLRLGLIHEAASDALAPVAVGAGEVRRALVSLAFGVVCTGLIYQVTAFALPKIFDERLQSSFADSVLGIGGLVSAVYGVAAVVQLIGGEMADRLPMKWVYVVCQIVQLPMLMVALMLASPTLVAVTALMVGLNVASQPSEDALLARYSPPAWRGRAFGVKFVLTFLVSAVGVALIPLVHRLTGSLDVLFYVLMACAAGAAVAGLSLPGRETVPAPVLDPGKTPLAAD